MREIWNKIFYTNPQIPSFLEQNRQITCHSLVNIAMENIGVKLNYKFTVQHWLLKHYGLF